ncbi:hypothetical protein K435DRAFT_825312 [Dendrothele bispora CBS 962.96]|uniref:Mitochondrial escape protein 2 n=1 Tax=Dendrothele bispora (strain CBS 962.96) TaxID=1314807 RepID=A0A4S8MXR7_DENBC|nr:hypothetical protein K435DRAFT_825312 [Dendrothele bispora CBS 962.96]
MMLRRLVAVSGPSARSSIRCFFTNTQAREGCVFVDSVFPIQVGRFDPRRYIGNLRAEPLLTSLKQSLSAVKEQNFQVLSLDPHPKDGGVFVRFEYDSDSEEALRRIREAIEKQLTNNAQVTSWWSRRLNKVWTVRGNPWPEDMDRFASHMIKVSFEGPDVPQETLYSLLRPYGRISDVTEPTPVPSGTLRSSVVTFHRLRDATVARNVIHGFQVQGAGGTLTKLRCFYQYPIQAHVIRDWVSSHPRVVLPVLFFLLGTLTYIVFDPIRIFMVQGKMLDWFDLNEFTIYKWLKANTLERLYTPAHPSTLPIEEVWQERKDAKDAILAYLSDQPRTVAFVYGPQGSGKTIMVESVLKEVDRKTLVIDCRELQKSTSDVQLLSALAKETGYMPVFSFLNSMNNLIDLASAGLIGQKAGFSTSIEEQLQQILNVVATALKKVGSAHREQIEKEAQKRKKEEAKQQKQTKPPAASHDGRLDCVSGNGVISELGVGDEKIQDSTGDAPAESQEKQQEGQAAKRQKNEANISDPLPVVVIRSYASKGGMHREEIMNVVATWAARLAESQIAHVIVISDNRENARKLTKALPSKPLNYIAFYDADSKSALSFVEQKLKDTNAKVDLNREEIAYIERLGGRSSDLESLVYKVSTGVTIKEGVEDIINRGVRELRKSTFGDDAEDAKGLPWGREQAWAVMKSLAKEAQIPYHDVLLNFPFKGDESALRSMEEAELITIGTVHGRPSVIRPGRPVYRYVFERLVNDPVFRATQEIAYNNKLITAAVDTIKSCETELLSLKEIKGEFSGYLQFSDPSKDRAQYLLKKMAKAEKELEKLEQENDNLKKVLVKNT